MDFNTAPSILALQELALFMRRDTVSNGGASSPARPLGFSGPRAWAQYANWGVLSLPFPEESAVSRQRRDIMLVMENWSGGACVEPSCAPCDSGGGLNPRRSFETIQSGACANQAARGSAPGRSSSRFADYEARSATIVRRVAGTAVAARGLAYRPQDRGVDAQYADYFLVSARTGGAAADAQGHFIVLGRKRRRPASRRSPIPRSRAAAPRLRSISTTWLSTRVP